ncbi:MAG: HEAT repeat domain-containing protein [Sedimentisphaerales bacterium]|nr:HEAT repeat domain-containing protein [Sedimentisphaerales bacterium]
MSKSKIFLVLLVMSVLAAPARTSGETVVPASKQAELIEVLKSGDASRKEKVDACRLLSIIATKEAVPVLASLLADEEMSHMARYALESIPDPSVDEAFRAALGKLKGRQRVGVIGSIGVRRDDKATTALCRLFSDSDPDVAQAAARALGSIGTPSAVTALNDALRAQKTRAPQANKLALYEGLLRCAEIMAADGQNKEAAAIYDDLRNSDAAHQVRGGAVRGAILTRSEKEGLKLMAQYLDSDDYILFSAAVQASLEMPGSGATKVLADGAKGLPADNRILIIKALGNRADASDELQGLAEKGEKAVRLEAVKAIAMNDDGDSVTFLAKLLDDGDKDIADAAQEVLASLSGSKVDKAIIAMLDSKDTANQLKALELIERRRTGGIADALLKAAKDNDESVRTASIRMLGDLAGEVDFKVLVNLMLGAKSAAEIRAAERALSTTCTRQAKPMPGEVIIRKAVYGAAGQGGSADVTAKVAEMVKAGAASIQASNANFGDPAQNVVKQLRIDFTANGVTQSKTVGENKSIDLMVAATPPELTNQLCAAIKKASPGQKLALLRVLRVAQGPRALEAVVAATKDSNEEVAAAAVSVLCGWPTIEALPEILKLTASSDNKVKILAVRGAIRLIPLQNVSMERKIAGFKELVPLIQRDGERRLLLGSLATVPASESLEMAMSYIRNANTKNEACFAAVAICEKLVEQKPDQVAAALKKVLDATSNADVTSRAKAVLEKAGN